MGLPAIIDIARQHLFADRDKMAAAGLPEGVVGHLLRLRDIYTWWVEYPSKRDADIVRELRSRHGVGDTAARQDLRLIKTLLGDFQKVTKDYMRYRATEMLLAAYAKAEEKGCARDMIAAARGLGEIHRLDQDDERASILDKVVPLVLRFTDDPETIGIKRVPNFREKIRALKEKYGRELTEDIEFEEIDAEIDPLFEPLTNPYGQAPDTPADSAGLS